VPLVPARGRHQLLTAGADCGEEHWRVTAAAGGGLRLAGEQETRAPHPFPSQMEWRAEVAPSGRLARLEVEWRVGTRELHTVHEAVGERWQVRIAHAGHTREQEGDYPAACEVVFGAPLLWQVVLQRYAWGPGAVHEFPALVVGPPWMAVEPGRMRVMCTGVGACEVLGGSRAVRVLEVHDLAGGAAPWRLEVDDADRVLMAYEGTAATEPVLRITALEH
jgi:hypothetical protein